MLYYYSFVIKLDRFIGSCNILNKIFNKVCVPNQTEDLNRSIFNMITWINESKTLRTHVTCKCKYKYDGNKCKSSQNWNKDKCKCNYPKKNCVCKKDYI